MEVEKRGKGGFLQLFDWNGKSRKKLFSSKLDVPGILLFLLVTFVMLVIVPLVLLFESRLLYLYAESSNHGKDSHDSVIARRQLVILLNLLLCHEMRINKVLVLT